MEQQMIEGIKLNMSQVFTHDGKVIPVTIIRALTTVGKEIENKEIVLVGKSKGKGFAGVMKRWNFGGGPATRGQSDKPRSGGSIGAQTPSRVFKGKKMAGHLGSKKVTIKGLRIIGVNLENNELLVTGPVPGSRSSKVLIRFVN